jgi:radical SAM superfamily enzyme YgiQ (UPF0313 family)
LEAAEDPEFLDAMYAAHIRGALVGIESVTPEGLKAVYKDFNPAGEDLVERLKVFARHKVYILGSFIFGLPTDNPDTFAATAALADKSEITFAQFVMMTPFPGTIDFKQWEKEMVEEPTRIAGHPLTRFWLIPQAERPKLYTPHPVMTSEEIRTRTQWVWDKFYAFRSIWKRSTIVPNFRSRIAFVGISKLYRQMYANTGISTDSARTKKATNRARWIAKPLRRFFVAKPMEDLEVPTIG